MPLFYVIRLAATNGNDYIFRKPAEYLLPPGSEVYFPEGAAGASLPHHLFVGKCKDCLQTGEIHIQLEGYRETLAGLRLSPHVEPANYRAAAKFLIANGWERMP